MTDRARRIIADCRAIAAMSEVPGRTTRRFLTPPALQVQQFLKMRMEAMGMTIWTDAVGNLRGVWSSAEIAGKRLVLGSHIDTVPDAGAFDGVLGVVLALELIAFARKVQLPLTLEVIAFSEEEGVRFGFPFIGSRAVAGCFDPAILDLKDTEEISVRQAIESAGLDPTLVKEAQATPDAIGFFEFHIEQGPVLDAEGMGVAAVTSIVGQTRLDLAFHGHANHAGTTPMHLRHDALAAAAEWITQVEATARRTEGAVATVGRIHVQPGAGNVIPGSAELSVDIRHVRDDVRVKMLDELLEAAAAVATARGLIFTWTKKMDERSVPMDRQLTAFLTSSMETAGILPKTMPSGAGHDAMIMASRMPAAMLFLRSPGGISHHPEESVLEDDVDSALQVGEKFLERLAAEVR